MNLMVLLEMAAQGFADRVAVRCGEDTLTYAQLLRAAAGGARMVRASGADHLAMLDVSSLALPVSLFASGAAGLPFVPLNYRLSAGELDSLLARIAPSYLLTDVERAASLAGRRDARVVARERFLEQAAEAEPNGSDWPTDPEAIAVLLFTSGTTGAPKAAVLRHRHLVSYVLASVEFGAAGVEEAVLVSVPPYHVAGIAAIASSVYAGRRMVQLPSFGAERWLELARRERVTHAFVVPTMLARIVDALGGRRQANLPQLRALAYGGGKMPLSVIERAMRLFPETNFTNAYGLTETSSTVTLLGPDDHRAAAASDDPSVRQRLASLGRALPGVEIEIRDRNGEPVEPGVRGEIHVRGEQVSGEYLGRESATDRDGWFPTRDGGWLDEQGYLFLEGRIDDVIVRGGENLSPGEIEDVLMQHEALADAAVVGVPDEQWGEAVVAAVVLKEGRSVGEVELQQWVKERLRSSRVPQRVAFRKALPYTDTGKLLRWRVRAELAREA